MNDEKLMEISKSVDNFILQCILDNQMTINTFNGLIMARLMIMNMEVKNADNFLQLLETVKETHVTIPYTTKTMSNLQ
jgi:CRISPR/Cas system-associated endonuclease Cas1